MEGIILEAETGDYLGKHRGFWFYTIGQRQGLRLPGGPWYVMSVSIYGHCFASRIMTFNPFITFKAFIAFHAYAWKVMLT